MTVNYRPNHCQGISPSFRILEVGALLLLAACSRTAPSKTFVRLNSPPPPPVLTSPKDGARTGLEEPIVCEFIMSRPSGNESINIEWSHMIIISIYLGNAVVAEQAVPFKGYTSYRVELDKVNRVGKYAMQVKVINYIKLIKQEFNTAEPAITLSKRNSFYVTKGAGK